MEIEYFYIHLVVTLLYFLLVRRKENAWQAGAEAILVLCLPVIGFFSLLTWHMVSDLKGYRKVREENLVKINPPSARGRMTYQSDIMSLPDMQLMGDEHLKRRLFRTIITQEVVDNPEILREAVHDEDREISYYAVSLITARAENITSAIFELEKKLRQERDSEKEAELLETYAGKLQEFIRGGYGDENQREERKKDLLKVLEELADKLPEKPVYREESIRLAISLQDFDHAEALLTLAGEKDRSSETFLRLSLELAIARRDREGTLSAIRRLKAFPGRLSPESLTAIRYWGGAA